MKQLSRLGIQRMIDTSGSAGSGGSGGNDISLAGYATEAWVSENYLSIEFFSRLFKAYGPAETSGDPDVEVVPNDVESTISNIKAMFGLWTDEYLSALGLGPSGGGGLSLNEPLASINTAGLANHPSSAGQTIVWNGSAWAYGTAGAGSVTSVGMTVPTGFVINGSPITSYGTLALSFATGYGLPLTADVDKGVTAYGWGNHANAGYALASNVYSKADADGRFLTISFFRSLFKAYQSNDTTEVVPNNGDTSLISSIKAMFGFWTEQYISALGLGPSGGGGVTLNEPLASINSAGLSAPTVTGSVLMWNGSSWTYNTQSGTDTKNTAGATNNTAISLYLVGAPSQTANPETYTRTGCYIDANGYLFSGGVKVLTDAVQSIVIGASGTPISPVNGVVTLPEYPTVTDTKNTAGATDLPNVKLYLIGANGQTANPQTYTNSGCYIDANGYLFSGGVKVLTSAVTSVVIGASGTPISPVNGVVTLPAYPSKTSDLTNDSGFITGYTDTKNTAGATDNVNTKLFLVGATSQGANPQTYTNQSCYIGSDNCLYSGGSKVQTVASGYLPLSGGTLTGMITGGTGNGFEVKSNTTSGYWTQGIRVYDNSGHYCTIALCDSNIQNVLALVINTQNHDYYFDVNVSGTNYRIDIPQKAGTMALKSDIPTYTDTKNTAGAMDLPNVKLYLIGANGQTANPQTYTNSNLYLGSDGVLNNTAAGDAISIGSSRVTNYSAIVYKVSGRAWATGADYTNDVFYLYSSYTNGHVVDISNLGAITAYSFVKKNGTSAQFLKADGSVDSNTYLTTYTNTKNTAGATNNTAINLYLVGAPSQSENPETYTRSGIYITSAGALVNTNGHEGLQLGNDTTNYSCVTYSSNYVTWAVGTDSNHFYFWNSTANDQVVKISASGTLSVGNVNTGNYKVAVNGSIICTSVTQTSDVRNKDIIADKTIELWQVAQAPIFTFTWRDKELGFDTHVGTSAQYWKSIVPEAVQQSGNGYLGMQYDVVALLAAVTTAKKVQDHEQRIQALERENEALRNELNRLKAA